MTLPLGGLGVGDNTRAVVTRGLDELTRLGVAMGGEAPTFAGLTGLGDLVATCMSPQNRNRYVGEQLGTGRSLDDMLDQMTMVAEGVKMGASVMELADRNGVEVPICHEAEPGRRRQRHHTRVSSQPTMSAVTSARFRSLSNS
jgi:glycerol-3-phosphate dehydrogenase (NAD(P)+)